MPFIKTANSSLFLFQVLELEATLERLTNEYQKAIEEKMRCQREADETTKTIQLANRKFCETN